MQYRMTQIVKIKFRFRCRSSGQLPTKIVRESNARVLNNHCIFLIDSCTCMYLRLKLHLKIQWEGISYFFRTSMLIEDLKSNSALMLKQMPQFKRVTFNILVVSPWHAGREIVETTFIFPTLRCILECMFFRLPL